MTKQSNLEVHFVVYEMNLKCTYTVYITGFVSSKLILISVRLKRKKYELLYEAEKTLILKKH